MKDRWMAFTVIKLSFSILAHGSLPANVLKETDYSRILVIGISSFSRQYPWIQNGYSALVKESLSRCCQR